MNVKSYKFKLYPYKAQEHQLLSIFEGMLLVNTYYFNLIHKIYEESGIILSYYYCKKDLVKLRKQNEQLAGIDTNNLNQALYKVTSAIKAHVKKYGSLPEINNTRIYHFSYRIKNTDQSIHFIGNKVDLPKFGEIKIRNKLKVEGNIINAIIKMTSTEQFYISINCYVTLPQFPKTGKVVGIDLWITNYITASDGSKIEYPRYLEKSADVINLHQYRLARKQSDSKNWNKERKKLAKIQLKVANQRKDFINKLTTYLIKEYDIICVEDLKVQDMLNEKRFSRQIEDFAWYEFINKLEYKANWYGKKIIKINTYYPSSKI